MIKSVFGQEDLRAVVYLIFRWPLRINLNPDPNPDLNKKRKRGIQQSKLISIRDVGVSEWSEQPLAPSVVSQ